MYRSIGQGHEQIQDIQEIGVRASLIFLIRSLCSCLFFSLFLRGIVIVFKYLLHPSLNFCFSIKQGKLKQEHSDEEVNSTSPLMINLQYRYSRIVNFCLP